MDVSHSCFHSRGNRLLCDAPCMFLLHHGRRRYKHKFLGHGQMLKASCSSNEVGTTYFYLRWEGRHAVHKTLPVDREGGWVAPTRALERQKLDLANLIQAQLLPNMTGNLLTLTVPVIWRGIFNCRLLT